MTRAEILECGSMGCLIYTILIFGFWGAIALAAVIVNILGNNTDQLSRV